MWQVFCPFLLSGLLLSVCWTPIFFLFSLTFLLQILSSLCPHYNCTAWGMETASWEKRVNAAVLVQKDYIPQSTAPPWTGLGLPDHCPLAPYRFSALYRSCVCVGNVRKNYLLALSCYMVQETEEGQVWLHLTAVSCCTHLPPETTSALLWEMRVGVSWLQGFKPTFSPEIQHTGSLQSENHRIIE